MSGQEPGMLPRLLRAIGLGRVSAAPLDGGPTQTVQVAFVDGVIDAVPVLYAYGFTASPNPGADAVVLHVDGDRTKGVVVATGDRRYRLKGLQNGEVALYDDLGQKVHLTRTGIVLDGGGLPVTIQNTSKVSVDAPLLEVSGDVVASGVSLTKHVHGGVQAGTAATQAPQED